MTGEWIVVLEVAIEREGSVALGDVERMVQALGLADAIALSGPDRYVVQVRIIGESCGDALLTAHSRWREAAGEVGLDPSDVVRAEVLTESEFEREREVGA